MHDISVESRDAYLRLGVADRPVFPCCVKHRRVRGPVTHDLRLSGVCRSDNVGRSLIHHAHCRRIHLVVLQTGIQEVVQIRRGDGEGRLAFEVLSQPFVGDFLAHIDLEGSMLQVEQANDQQSEF